MFKKITIDELTREGYKGAQEELDNSLFYDGFAWKETDSEYTFILSCGELNDDFKHLRFFLETLPKECDLFKEFPWVDGSAIVEAYGLYDIDLKELPLYELLQKMIEVYGIDNFFQTDPELSFQIVYWR